MKAVTRVAFLWHFHQPDFRDPVGVGDLLLPWVRLHATRAYTDLAHVLETHEHVRATVNISPSLTIQLDELSRGRCGDRYLDLSKRNASDLTLHDRIEILRGFFSLDWETEVRPIERYWELLHLRGRDFRTVDLERIASEFSDQQFRDLQVLFNLASMGFWARAHEPVVRNLLRKGRDFTEVEKQVLLEAQHRILCDVLPRWRRLGETERIELSTSPLHHPILPLLFDSDHARRSIPEANLPPRLARPDDARAQIERGVAEHRERLGFDPVGIWPPEGSVSPEICEMLRAAGARWIASDQAVLRLSRAADGEPIRRRDIYRPWRLNTPAGELAILFRDQLLSDLIAFTYAHNPADESVQDLVTRLRRVGEHWSTDEAPTVVVLVLDGENPWARYPDSGEAFLTGLHQALGDPSIETVTMAEAALDSRGARTLASIHTGSWIEASHRVWIGDAETNSGWELLGKAGQTLDARGPDMAVENREEAYRHLLTAQGSDWFWWFGDDFHAESPEVFDSLFRAHLAKIYELTGDATPAALRRPISKLAEGAARRRAVRPPRGLLTPIIDGKESVPAEWFAAGLYRPTSTVGSMYQSTRLIECLHYGVDLTELFLRLDLTPAARERESLGLLAVTILAGEIHHEIALELRRDGQSDGILPDGTKVGRAVFGAIIEVALPFAQLGLPRGARVLLAARLLEEGVEIERLPRYGHLTIDIPTGNESPPSLQA